MSGSSEPLTADERSIAVLEEEIARAWLILKLGDAALLWPLVVVGGALYVFMDTSVAVLYMLGGVGLVLSTIFTFYWIMQRIKPMQRELERRRGDASAAPRSFT